MMISPDFTKLTNAAGKTSTASLQVDVIADFICPWSFLGKRRLDEALAAVGGPSRVSWYPFQINPAMPDEGVAFDDYLRGKFGEPDALKPGMDALIESGAREGINFRFDRIERIPGTLNAHKLMALAEEHDRQTGVLADLIFHAFFELGKDISDIDVLSKLGETVGLRATAIREMFESDRLRSAVIANEAQVRRNGVTAVPDFLINQRLFVMGAQTTADMVRIFDRVMFGDESNLSMSSTLH